MSFLSKYTERNNPTGSFQQNLPWAHFHEREVNIHTFNTKHLHLLFVLKFQQLLIEAMVGSSLAGC